MGDRINTDSNDFLDGSSYFFELHKKGIQMRNEEYLQYPDDNDKSVRP